MEAGHLWPCRCRWGRQKSKMVGACSPVLLRPQHEGQLQSPPCLSQTIWDLWSQQPSLCFQNHAQVHSTVSSRARTQMQAVSSRNLSVPYSYITLGSSLHSHGQSHSNGMTHSSEKQGTQIVWVWHRPHQSNKSLPVHHWLSHAMTFLSAVLGKG